MSLRSLTLEELDCTVKTSSRRRRFFWDEFFCGMSFGLLAGTLVILSAALP